MRRATRRAGSGSSWGRATPAPPALERGEDGVLVLLQRGRVGRAAAEGRDVRGDDERVRGADRRRAGRRRSAEDAAGHGERARAQAVDAAATCVLEGQRHELGVVRGRPRRRARGARRGGPRARAPAPVASTSAPTSAATSSQVRSLTASGSARRAGAAGATARRPSVAGADGDDHRAARSPSACWPSSRSPRASSASSSARSRARRRSPPRQDRRRARSSIGRTNATRTAVPSGRRPYRATSELMEAATPLPFSQVRIARRAPVDRRPRRRRRRPRCAWPREREEAGDDVARLVLDAIAIGARVLDREQTGANADFVKAEFEKAARELDAAFVDRARLVAERLDARIDEVFGPENGHVTKALARHFGDESLGRRAEPRPRAAGRGRRADARGPAPAVLLRRREQPARRLPAHARTARCATTRRRSPAAQGDGREARGPARGARPACGPRRTSSRRSPPRRERGTAKGRTLRGGRGRGARRARAAARRRLRAPSATSRRPRARRATSSSPIGACHGPAQGRIVFEAKNSRLSRPEALRQLDERAARAQRRLRGARRALRGARSRRGCTRCASTTATSSSSPTTPTRARSRCRSPTRWPAPACSWPAAAATASTARRWPTRSSARVGRARGRPAHPPAAHRRQDADRQGLGDRRAR